jgi:hypothetical protein
MTTLLNPPLAVGSTVQRKGFFTKRHTLGDLSDGRELERRIGYSPGTLASGWYVLLMIGRPPGPAEFMLAGFSHFSGGHVRGHQAVVGEHVEASLRAQSVDVLRSRAASARNFSISGPQRLAKISPVLRCQVFWHPDPNPIPQWELTEPMEFVVSAFYGGLK